MSNVIGLWLRALVRVCLGLFVVGGAYAQAPCADCNILSRHSMDWCTASDGMGGSVSFGRTTDPEAAPLSARAVLGKGCDIYAEAHSDGYKVSTWNYCNPVLPAPNLASYGGTWGSYSVEGSIVTKVRSSGAVINSGSGTWGLATCGCVDQGNQNLVGLGNDGYCYCKAGHSWDDSLKRCVKIQEKIEAQKPLPPGACFGNPIYPLTGVKKEFIKSGMGVGGIELTLTYDSTMRTPVEPKLQASELVDPASFGGLWKSNLHHRLRVSLDLKSALLSRGDGSVINFIGDGFGTFTGTADNPHQLSTVSGGHIFTDAATGDQETFDIIGRLTSMATARGMVLTFTYTDGKLVQVAASDGRSLRFAYGDDLVTKVWDENGAALSASYDTARNLVALTWPDGKPHQFLYENPELPWALTGKIDENNTRYATFVYDAVGRVLSTEYAGGVDRFSVAYGTPPMRLRNETYDPATNTLYRNHIWQLAQGVTVTLPNGESIALDSVNPAGVPMVSARSQPASSGCAASTSARAYDEGGNVLSEDDFKGMRTCYAYDSKNREISRVEGLANTVSCSTVTPAEAALPLGARKIKTEWHPNWRLPTKLIHPLRTTTLVYHGDGASCTSAAPLPSGQALPVVCKQIEQATLADGTPDLAPRITNFAYDSAGRILSSVDGNGRTTTYAYFSDTAYTSGLSDPNIGKVSLLLHGNSEAPGVFADSGAYGQVATVIGSPAGVTAQKKYGSSSIAFNGSSDALSYAHSENLNLALGDFTIETWVYVNSLSLGSTILQKDQLYGSTFPSYALSIGANGSLNAHIGTGSTAAYSQWVSSAAGLIAPGNWHHVAYTRQGTTLRLFVNGALVQTATQSRTATDGGKALVIGRYPSGGGAADGWLNGYIDDLRITKGLARYTASFAAPSAEFPNDLWNPGDIGHRAGDLQSVTNAAGHVTQFTQYTRAGRVRQMSDPKGVTTDIVYTPRGWVSSVTTTAPGTPPFTTGYVFDNAGQLTQVNLPDGTSLGYSYDAAHRLTGVTDTRGNSVTYTLDNSGNRTAEEVRDPSGTLQRSISRSFDALNRLQQVTGAPM